MCIKGKRPACITENIVIASADLLIPILHFCLKRSNTAEIRVPACPIPIHHTKFVMSQAHPTVLFNPQTPIPVEIVYIIHPTPHRNKTIEIENTIHHCLLA